MGPKAGNDLGVLAEVLLGRLPNYKGTDNVEADDMLSVWPVRKSISGRYNVTL